MKKDTTLKIRCTEEFKEDLKYIAKMEDLKNQTKVLEYLVKEQLKMYQQLGIVRK